MAKLKYRYIAVFFAVVFQLLLFTGCTFSSTVQKSGMDSEDIREESLSSNSSDDTMKTENVIYSIFPYCYDCKIGVFFAE